MLGLLLLRGLHLFGSLLVHEEFELQVYLSDVVFDVAHCLIYHVLSINGCSLNQ